MPPRRSPAQAPAHDGGSRRICVANRRVALHYDARGCNGTEALRHSRQSCCCAGCSLTTRRRPEPGGPYARIAVLRPHDGDTVDFEAGYIRHLEWHRQADDTGSGTAGPSRTAIGSAGSSTRSFGHAAADFDNPVSPAEDERDNVLNVTPHAAVRRQCAVRVPAGALARHGRAAADGAARIHDRRSRPRRRGGLRDERCEPRNRRCSARRFGIGWSPAEPRRATSGCARRRRIARDVDRRLETNRALPREDTAWWRNRRRDPHAATDDELRPRSSSPVTTCRRASSRASPRRGSSGARRISRSSSRW